VQGDKMAKEDISFENFTAAIVQIVVLCVVTPYKLVGRYGNFGGTYYINLQR
jgi:hypothetical protein